MTPPPGAPFFVVNAIPSDGTFLLDGPEGHHAAAVRRLRVGESLVLSDGAGRWAPATVTAVEKNRLQLAVQPAEFTPAPRLRVVLVQALPKGEHADLAVDLATQAGVDEIIPWSAERSIARWTGDKAAKGVAKWRQTAREAAKQARRPWIPSVADPVSAQALVDRIGRADHALILHESGSCSLTSLTLRSAGELLLVVGPEGGISPTELGRFSAAGAQIVRLGPEVLRTSSAAAVCLGAVAALTGRWDIE